MSDAAPVPSTVILCGSCRKHLLRLLAPGRWWCPACDEVPGEPALVYDRRR